VPGNITSQTSFGPNYLIKDGAKLVQHWRDVVEELPRNLKEKILGIERPATSHDQSNVQPIFEAVELSQSEHLVLEILSPEVPSHIDQLLITSGMNSSELMNALLGLEMKDRIKQLPGKSFIRRM